MKCRDDSKGIFHSTCWDHSYYCGKSVLDIACNGGYFAFEAKRNGADKVVAFDAEPWLINKAKTFRDLLELDVELHESNFWNWDWKTKYDIVFCNQCIYHFANDHFAPYSGTGSSRIPDVLDNICNAVDNHLVMFTFIKTEDPEYANWCDGYKPGSKKIEEDLLARGFKEVRIYQPEGGAKRTVVASKKPWEYIWPDRQHYKTLVWRTRYIDYHKLNKWNWLDEIELLNCYES
jgi:SAM-dependent methyltransferase